MNRPATSLEIEVARLKVSTRLKNQLARLPIRSLRELEASHYFELQSRPNLGRKSLAELKEVFRDNGIVLPLNPDEKIAARLRGIEDRLERIEALLRGGEKRQRPDWPD